MTQMTDPTLVVYGAGNIGRGIVSLLFGAAGYRLLFYRRDREALVKMQAKGGYVIHRLGGGEDVPVSDFQVLTSQEELLQALTGCNMTACCLYPSVFPQVGAVLAEACRIRTDPLNVLLCCNEPGGAELLSRAVTQALLPEEGDGPLQKLHIIPTIVCSVGFPTPDGAYDVTVSCNGYLKAERSAFSGPVPQIPGLELVDGVNARLYRKLYLGNMFHTYAALLGAKRGYETMSQCYADPQVRRWVEEAFFQSEAALLTKWKFEPSEYLRWRTMMLNKMDQPSEDRTERVLKDMHRKLRREDRLVGPALLCLQNGYPCSWLVQAICLALERLGSESPDFAQQLRRDPAAAAQDVCGLEKEDRAQQMLVQQIVRWLKEDRNSC